ncbi:hypothetical protein ACET3Z_020458 [Daucus carota]
MKWTRPETNTAAKEKMKTKHKFPIQFLPEYCIADGVCLLMLLHSGEGSIQIVTALLCALVPRIVLPECSYRRVIHRFD